MNGEEDINLSVEGQLDVSGLRFVVDMDSLDLSLLIASVETTLEHPQLRDNSHTSRATASEYERLREKLLRLLVEQVESGPNRRAISRTLRRKWSRPSREEGSDGE